MAVQFFRLLLFTLFTVMLLEMGGWRFVSDMVVLNAGAAPFVLSWESVLFYFNGGYYGITQINTYFHSPVLEWFLLVLAIISARIAFCAGTDILSRLVAAVARGTAQNMNESKPDA